MKFSKIQRISIVIIWMIIMATISTILIEIDNQIDNQSLVLAILYFIIIIFPMLIFFDILAELPYDEDIDIKKRLTNFFKRKKVNEKNET